MILRLGDCIEVMRGMEANTIDTCITDPPYELGFMGKKWDSSGVAFQVATWEAVYRVLKPGALLLAFGGTRTYHRMVCAIEDAGFEIRDTIAWVYGSGFPKSYDISKGIDKANGREFEDRYALGRHIRDCRERLGVSRKDVNERFGAVAVCNHWEAQDRNNALPPTPQDWAILKDWLGCDPMFDTLVDRIGAEREVIGKGEAGFLEKNKVFELDNDGYGNFDITAPATPAAKLWHGWGTALKPAFEPIVIAQKPIDGTYAENALKWGVAGLWIDGGRVGTEIIPPQRQGKDIRNNAWSGNGGKSDYVSTGSVGRFPANFVHDGSDEVLECFPQTKSGNLNHGHKRGDGTGNSFMGGGGIVQGNYGGDSGSAARFFYCAKASRSERNAGLEGAEPQWIDESRKPDSVGGNNPRNRGARADTNFHPTVKPISLMRYLVRLTKTPTGGVVLDPFMGSGTTGCACALEGRDFIGIEREPAYMEIARRRIEHWAQQQPRLI